MTTTPTAVPEVPLVHVLAGVLLDASGRVLLAERPVGKAFAGRWEFPGGKREPGESPRDALDRELREEIGVEVIEAEPLLAVTHRYPGAPVRVLIDSWRVLAWRGAPQSLDGQRLRWCEPGALPAADILEADRPIVTALRLPSLFAELGDALRTERDPSDPAPGAIAVYSSPARIVRANDSAALAGCVVADGPAASAAVARGADFLLVSAPVDDALAAHLTALGVPWYLDESAARSATAHPTGHWRSASPD